MENYYKPLTDDERIAKYQQWKDLIANHGQFQIKNGGWEGSFRPILVKKMPGGMDLVIDKIPPWNFKHCNNKFFVGVPRGK